MTDPITITEIPAITPLPVIDRTQPPSVVRPQVDKYFGTQLPTFTGQLNAVSEAIVQLGQDVLALRQATAADKSAAEGFKTQAGLYASAADTSRGLAAAEKEAAEDARDDAQDARDAAQVFANAAGAAVGLPAPLASRPLAALRVTAAGTGVEATYEAPAGDVKHIEITASAALTAAQKGALIDVSGSGITLTLDAAALGNGWWCYVRNIGTAAVTASAAAGQTIDGVTSGPIRPGMTLLVQCDGTAFHCVRVGPYVAMEALTSGTSWTAPLGVRSVRVRCVGGGSGSGNGQPLSPCSGAYLEALVSVAPGVAYTYSIGVGGNTTAGGSTSIVIGGRTLVAQGSLHFGTVAGVGAASGGDVNLGGFGGTVGGAASPLGRGGDAAQAIPPGYGGGVYRVSGSSTMQGGQGCIILEY